MAAMTSAPLWMSPMHAVHPMIGGIAPTTDPTHVFAMDHLFMGVYTDVYSRMLSPPRSPVRGFTWLVRRATPRAPLLRPNSKA